MRLFTIVFYEKDISYRYIAWIGGHWHRGRCRRHRHSSTRYLSPLPKHSGTGLGPLIPVPDWVHLLRYRIGSGIGLYFIQVPDWPNAGQSGILAFEKHFTKINRITYSLHVHTGRAGLGCTLWPVPTSPHYWWWKGVHPTRSYCGGQTDFTLHKHIHCVGQFRHHGAPGTDGHGLVRHCEPMPK